MTNLDYLKRYLIQADRDLAESRARIVRQREYLKEREQTNQNVASGTKLLDVMLTTHESMENHRRTLSDAISAQEKI